MTYEPELHPGAVLRFDDVKGNLRVFSTGSVTVTAPTVSGIHESVTRAYQMVSPIALSYLLMRPLVAVGGSVLPSVRWSVLDLLFGGDASLP